MSALAVGMNSNSFNQAAPPPARENYLQGMNDSNWSSPYVPTKPPQREGVLIDFASITLRISQNQAAVSKDIDDLKAIYVFADDSIDCFLEEHRAHRNILRQAIEPLKASFGTDKVFRLEINSDEDDCRTLYGVTLWRDSVRTAAQALSAFVEDWWLDHMNADTRDLAFIYRISR
jgi:hypothetical protein